MVPDVRILVVEDEPSIGTAVAGAIRAEGHAVDLVADGDEAVEWADAYPYDLLVLDVRLPGTDGFDVCRRVRSGGSDASILMLTALDDVDDRVTGLDAGADDYLAKPFATAELMARVRALLRRHGSSRAPVVSVGDLELDTARHQVRRDGADIRLTAREFALLEFLVRGAGRIYSQERLIEVVSDAEHDIGSNLIEVYVRSLRRKLDGGRRDGLIETVRGVGYRVRRGTCSRDAHT